MRRLLRVASLCVVSLASPLVAQQPAPAAANAPIPQPRPMPPYPHVPMQPGFRVFIIPDMEGLASVVFNRDITAGNETSAARENPLYPFTHDDYWDHYRDIATREVNATIAGARRAGARSFVVNEGHGGNLFASLLPWDLDTAALLIRGWPKPEVMSTGIDSTFGALIMTAVHAGPRRGGIIAHAYAFDSIIVNGHWLNETGFNALVAGEFGVPIVMVSGDDIAMQQAREQLGNDRIPLVTTKIAIGGSAGIMYSPAVVRQMLRDSAAVGIARAMRHEIQPFRLEKPYQVDLVLRRTFPQNFVDAVDSIQGFPTFRKTGDHTYHMVTSDAREIARLFDVIEAIALR